MAEESVHSKVVDEWLSLAAASMSPAEVVRLFDAALRALCARTQITLGEVTMTAIVSRVREFAVEQHPLLAPTRVERGGLCLDGVVLHDPSEAHALRVGLRFVVVELLRVLGVLTAEILTPALHETLTRVRCAPASQSPEGTGR